MQSKIFEVRDRGTLIVAMATQLGPGCEAERRLLGWAGYTPDPSRQAEYIVLTKLNGGQVESKGNPFEWRNDTMRAAHQHVLAHWNDLNPGDVIDAEYLRGERDTPKTSDLVGIEEKVFIAG